MTIAAKDIEAADLPDNLQKRDYSPYHFFTAEEWSRFRADTPMTLTADEVQRLRSLNDPVDLGEVRQIYLSLSRLLSTHVESSQMLFEQINPATMNRHPPPVFGRHQVVTPAIEQSLIHMCFSSYHAMPRLLIRAGSRNHGQPIN